MIRRIDKDDVLTVAFAICAFGLIALVVIGAIENDKKVRARCRDMGGRIISKSAPSVGVGANGQVTVGSADVSFCISADGRIIE